MKAIEVDFPFEPIDAITEMESWRKEVNRPPYYIHKWWAKRLGSVFRAMILGTVLEANQDIWSEFYTSHHFDATVILDPFMGSGTTPGECVKLGIQSIGCDINPISTFMVRQALTRIDETTLLKTFREIEHDVKDRIQQYYTTIDPRSGQQCDALYYFWVKMVETPEGEKIPLFKHYVFSKHAYPHKHPEAHILCPHCWTVNTDLYNAVIFQCAACDTVFHPQTGTATEQTVISRTGTRYKIKDLLAQTASPPEHRLYAIMALNPEGEKIYLTPTQFDHDLFQKAREDFRTSGLSIPDMEIRDGYNTRQVRGYGYQYWRQFFNERQLLCLSLLFDRIRAIPEQPLREQFLCLFSSTLEFNNLFCSFKGEGTGAVRHLFSHHILKPEKTPLENTVWGTPKSSGTFSTLFTSRLLRAKRYLQAPFEIRMHEKHGRKTTRKERCSVQMDTAIVDSYSMFLSEKKSTLILNGDSASLPLPDHAVDAVVTDPPYFDFVHYSELSDFFYAWLQIALHETYRYFARDNSSDPGEVQGRDSETFSRQLSRVFSECFRVLKPRGLLVFSFHHSKPGAWLSIYQAVTTAQFRIMAAHPVKAEMSVSTIKSATKNPINLDAILVCKKDPQFQPENHSLAEVWSEARRRAQNYCQRLTNAGRVLSQNDQYVILSAQILVSASKSGLEQAETHQLLERAYATDFSQAEGSAKQVHHDHPEHFWKTQLVTEQTSFAFLHETTD